MPTTPTHRPPRRAALAAHRGETMRIEAVNNPDDPGGALLESGALLPGPHAILAGPTFEEWLTGQANDES